MVNLVILASGSGTNAERIINYFASSNEVHVKLVLSNNPGAFVLERARRLQVPCGTFTKADMYDSDRLLERLRREDADWVILAGFMLQVPDAVLNAFPGRIINIHPALLPAYGGKGMFGHHVHEAVIRNHESESGITVHYVDGELDHGRIIMQAHCPVYETDTPDTLAGRIHLLEQAYFPVAIEQAISASPVQK